MADGDLIMTELPGVEEHELASTYPTRLPVWWGREGVAGVSPDKAGTTGRKVVLRFEKKFGKLEKIVFKFLGGTKEMKRSLDNLNSMLWELSDGSRTFAEICTIMDSLFHEKVAPVQDRTALGLNQFQQLGVLAIMKAKFDQGWPTGPGVIPPSQTMTKGLDGIDSEPLEGEIVEWPLES
jgi:hypothetical protein